MSQKSSKITLNATPRPAKDVYSGKLQPKMDQFSGGRAVSDGTSTYAVSQMSYDARNREDCTAIRMNPATWVSLPASACTLGTAGADRPDRISRKLAPPMTRSPGAACSIQMLRPLSIITCAAI